MIPSVLATWRNFSIIDYWDCIVRKPNFFLIGAPKCGTTSFQEYLSGHPLIFMSTPKEPCYFAKDLLYPTSPRNIEEYMQCFVGSRGDHKIIGEASVDYLYSKVAVDNVLAFNPDARFMVMVRNPIDMARSMHSYSFQTLEENVEDFELAWRLQDDRVAGRALPVTCAQRDFLLYGRYCKLGEQLQRLLSKVSLDRVHIVVFDDMLRDPGATYLSALNFLDVPTDGRSNFESRNITKSHKSKLIHKLTWSLAVLRRQIPVRSFGIPLINRLNSLNLAGAKRFTLSPSFQAELAEYFRSDVNLLSSLLGRDLSPWLVSRNRPYTPD